MGNSSTEGLVATAAALLGAADGDSSSTLEKDGDNLPDKRYNSAAGTIPNV